MAWRLDGLVSGDQAGLQFGKIQENNQQDLLISNMSSAVVSGNEVKSHKQFNYKILKIMADLGREKVLKIMIVTKDFSQERKLR